MNARLARRLALSALCAAMGCVLWLELATRGEDGAGLVPGPAELGHPVVAARSDPAFAPPPIAAFHDIEARPLFWASRRPIAGADGLAAAPSGLVLLGVVRDEEDAIALIRHGQPPKLERLKEGAALEGWTVSEVTLNGVLLVRGDARAELKPRPAPPAAGAARPPPSPIASQQSAPARR
ncbi:MAG TPA: hypothetical protein VE397_20265 [Stellaceae bacterium]|nr:hypothetical protein [Stellaceae bacterium]